MARVMTTTILKEEFKVVGKRYTKNSNCSFDEVMYSIDVLVDQCGQGVTVSWYPCGYYFACKDAALAYVKEQYHLPWIRKYRIRTIRSVETVEEGDFNATKL